MSKPYQKNTDTSTTPETKNASCSKNIILHRQYYNDVNDISHLQVLLPVQSKDILLNSLHGEAGNYPGIS